MLLWGAMNTDDVRINRLKPLIPPAILIEEIPLGEAQSAFVERSRKEVGAVVSGLDDRLLCVVGPCSIHDPKAALEYAGHLKTAADRLSGELKIVMRTYFEKPRTTVGWKGLINDPALDGSFRINDGLRQARGLLIDVVEAGLPPGTEFLDPISPQFVADVVCWGAIGARTSESQVHRELASGLSMPVGFKNGTGGSVKIALDAIGAASQPHQFLSVTKQGLAAIVETKGNEHTHLILRGGGGKSNFGAESVSGAARGLTDAGLKNGIMIDCSHANSGKDPEKQPLVADAVAQQLEAGAGQIIGVMVESFLVAGNQKLGSPDALTYGQSVTDACLSWKDTVPLLERLARGVSGRRKRG